MIQNGYCVYDSVAAAFLPPFFCPSDALAKRSFRLAISDDNHVFHACPGDFILYKVSTFDDTTGSVMPLPVIENLGPGSQFLVLGNTQPVHFGEVVK